MGVVKTGRTTVIVRIMVVSLMHDPHNIGVYIPNGHGSDLAAYLSVVYGLLGYSLFPGAGILVLKDYIGDVS